MDFLNILGGGAFILTCIALYMLRNKNSYGWLVFLPSYVLQVIIFYYEQYWFLLFQMIVLFIFSLINFIKWESENENLKSS